MKIFKSAIISFTTWILAALLNAILAGTWLSFSDTSRYRPEAYMLAFLATLIFSMPGMFIFWIILLIRWDEALLFRYLLKAGFIISSLSSLILYAIKDMVGDQQLSLSFFVVIASISSVMMHHSIIKSIKKIN